LEYFVSLDIFFAGRNVVDTTKLSSYHIRDPEAYILEWLEMSNRPFFFVGDGDRFSDIIFWKQCLFFGLKAIIFHCCCDPELKSKRHENRGRGPPNAWQSISDRFDQLISWKDKAVKVMKIDTTSRTSFNIIIDTIKPQMCMDEPERGEEKEDFTYNGVTYSVFTKMLPNNVLSFLNKYAQETLYMKEEGLVHGKVRQKPRGIRVEGNLGCGIAYKNMGVDPLCMHPMVRYDRLLVCEYMYVTMF
jgi:hypothetical protein